MHYCQVCGVSHEDAEPVVEENPVIVVDAEPAAEANVEIARIEGETAVQMAKISAKSDEVWRDSRIAELEGENRGLREALDALQPAEVEPVTEPAEVEPVLIEETPDDVVPVESPEPAPAKTTKRKSGAAAWWS